MARLLFFFDNVCVVPLWAARRDLDSKRRKVREARSAGLVVIGDEILKGKCFDSNTAFATKKLWEKVTRPSLTSYIEPVVVIL